MTDSTAAQPIVMPEQTNVLAVPARRKFMHLNDLIGGNTKAVYNMEGLFVDMFITLDDQEVAAMRPFLPHLLAYYSSELQKLDPVLLSYVNSLPDKKDELKKQLFFTFYLHYLQLRLDEIEGRQYKLADSLKKLNYCLYLLRRLDLGKLDAPEKQLEVETESATKAGAYCGFLLADFLSNKVNDLMGAKTVTLIEWLNIINERRLYWVWGGGMLQSVLDLLPKNMTYLNQAQKGLAAPAPYTGYISWVLYFTRLGLNVFMVFKHTVPGFWMTDEEKKFSWRQRWRVQWQQRKFSMLNDFIWGIVNLACFFWLYGPGMLGYAGNAATVVLLLMDLSLVVWRYREQSEEHKLFIESLDKAQLELEQNLQAATLARDEELMKQYAFQIKQNKRLRVHKLNEWNHEHNKLINEVTYAVTLVVAFAIVASFLIPPFAIAPASALILVAAGSVLCFLLTGAMSIINDGLDVKKNLENKKDADFYRQEAEDVFKSLASQYRLEKDEDKKAVLLNEMKLCYLDIQHFSETSAYEKEMAKFQKLHLIRAIFVDALIPVVIFASLMFMPMGVGVGVMAAGLALIILSKVLINQLEPKAPEMDSLMALNEEEQDAVHEERLARFEADFKVYFNKVNALEKPVKISESRVKLFKSSSKDTARDDEDPLASLNPAS